MVQRRDYEFLAKLAVIGEGNSTTNTQNKGSHSGNVVLEADSGIYNLMSRFLTCDCAYRLHFDEFERPAHEAESGIWLNFDDVAAADSFFVVAGREAECQTAAEEESVLCGGKACELECDFTVEMPAATRRV